MITHKTIKTIYGSQYMCNLAVKPKGPQKYTENWDKVTCQNCLKQKPKKNELQKLQRDYKNYQEAQAYSNMLIIIGILGYIIALITSYNILGIILAFVSSISIGFGIGMKLKTIFKVLK